MGGGPKPVNSGQAATSSANANAASQQSLALSAQNAATEKQMLSKLFGTGQGDNQGSLGGMLDPSKLNEANLSGAYKSAYNQSTNQLSKDYANQKGSLAQDWANKGMTSGSTPSGFQADQERKLGSAEADTRGQAFTGALGAQHQETLNNFWNAGNIASGQAATAGGNAATNAGNAGQTATGIFSTAGKQAQTGTSAQTGITEAALCPTSGMKIMMADRTAKPVEELTKGDALLGIDGAADELVEIELSRPVHVCDVSTAFRTVRVSVTHTFERADGGWVCAGSAKDDVVETLTGAERVTAVECLDEPQVCYYIRTKRSHGYVVEGFYSFE